MVVSAVLRLMVVRTVPPVGTVSWGYIGALTNGRPVIRLSWRPLFLDTRIVLV
jgi:hypothetical protein